MGEADDGELGDDVDPDVRMPNRAPPAVASGVAAKFETSSPSLVRDAAETDKAVPAGEDR